MPAPRKSLFDYLAIPEFSASKIPPLLIGDPQLFALTKMRKGMRLKVPAGPFGTPADAEKCPSIWRGAFFCRTHAGARNGRC